MSQRAFLQSLDAQIHDALAAAGLADGGGSDVGACTYLRPGGDPDVDAVPCRIYVDRGIQQSGEYGQVVGPRDVIAILRADVPDPQQGATVTFAGETVTLDAEDNNDDGVTRWVVGHAP